ncbi:cytidine(C)-cytidine(C)-adenosine (A)]-adding enzyme [Aureimonas endophytica]|uniref:Cytidine(C)-cytidine(C)-adenosine (A)]-adding enzyme n=1 Tax=Aureimonas endophytica TaxID=2027858 RepID=A0A916ZYQ5_9HYPH|nr:CCA tRNA nucleotidyltransferase [Aureimonas endophytica]GGE19290.1 cytidine(C)-cytidine(C)-adenosine (A)]-adding enzyme [Aureimonas endophytica]
MTETRIDAEWLRDETLQRLLAALAERGEGARVVGGAVRNTLLGLPVTDIDIATTVLPEETSRRAEAAGFKPVPTGLAHGTITVVAAGRPFEVTTLRRDVETDGRHARVAFGRDWEADATRRDFTINALYCEADGRVVDLVGGIADLETRTLRFIGDAASRIEEDYLRILRFFRFFAWYGAGRPDAEGLRACARLKSGLAQLSAERVWAELRKLLGAADPSRALLWARQAGVLSMVLPESERWGIDTIHGLVGAEQVHGWAPDALLRLEAIVPPDGERLAELARRLKLANAERDRLLAFALAAPADPSETDQSLRARLYFGDRGGIRDRLRLAIATRHGRSEAAAIGETARLNEQLRIADMFDPPAFPVSGEDLKAVGVQPGPVLGAALDRLKRLWAESGFVLSRDVLLSKL